MFFAVIIPTHKRKKKLTLLLNSLSEQVLDSHFFEVIVVSTENDEALSLNTSHWSYDLKILTIPNDPFKGKSAAAKRNYGVKKAQYPWIAFVDDDCIASKNWLSSAKLSIEKNTPDAIEGGVHIPTPAKPTLTYRGIKRLSLPGGYQTCNMFYNKETFLEVKGFDLHFPFYLEDSDLAWTMIKNKKKIIYCPEAEVSHPVPPAEPKRLLSHALRMEKLIYLYRKHPEQFKPNNKTILSKAYKALISIDILTLISLCLCLKVGLTFIGLKTLTTLIYTIWLFRGSHYTLSEFALTLYYLLICPTIAFIKLIQGLLIHKKYRS